MGNWKILKCPECESTEAPKLSGDLAEAECSECGHRYPVRAAKPRTARPGHRHRRDNGPAELVVKPVPPPDPKVIGALTRFTTEIVEGGVGGIVKARKRAEELAKRFGVEIEKEWQVKTKWLGELADSSRAGARHALHASLWRPRYLAMLSITHSSLIASRAAHISKNTAANHRNADPEFDVLCKTAEVNAIELLHDVTFKSAVEGDLEPVFWQGIPIGYVRKIDNRLRIEMLRAHMPQTFKTPGSKLTVNSGGNVLMIGGGMMCGPDETAELQGQRQRALDRIAAKRLPAPTAPEPVIDVP